MVPIRRPETALRLSTVGIGLVGGVVGQTAGLGDLACASSPGPGKAPACADVPRQLMTVMFDSHVMVV